MKQCVRDTLNIAGVMVGGVAFGTGAGMNCGGEISSGFLVYRNSNSAIYLPLEQDHREESSQRNNMNEYLTSGCTGTGGLL